MNSFYAGQPPLNRLSFQRQSADKLNEHLEAPNARFVLYKWVTGACPLQVRLHFLADHRFRDLKPLVHKDEPGKLLFLSRKQVEARLGGPFQSPYVKTHFPLAMSIATHALSSPEDAQSKDRARLFEAAHLPHTLPALVFLGVDDRPDASSTSVPARADPMHPEGVPYFALDTGTEDWEIEGGEFGDARASGSAMGGWEAGVFALSRALIDWNVRNKVGGIRFAEFLARVQMT